MDDYAYFLKKVEGFHGGTCTGIALGTRITLAAMRYLGFNPHDDNHKNMIVFVEVDRCMTDAVQAITGCSLGRRSLKHIDYGKFAATFVNLKTGKAVRGTIEKIFSNQADKEAIMKEIATTPDDELVTLQAVKVDIPPNDLPGSPRASVICQSCGERVVDGRHVHRGETVLCKACSNGSYYQPEGETHGK